MLKSRSLAGTTIALLLCMCSGCNSRLAGPGFYWSQNGGALLGFLAICALVLIAIMILVLAIDNCSIGGPKVYRETCGGSVLLLGVVWGVAVLVLQAMPTSTEGIAVIPLLPWSCSGWAGALASLALWAILFTGIGCFCFASDLGDRKAGAWLMVTAFSVNALLPFWCSTHVDTPPVGNQSDASVPSYQQRLERLESQRKGQLQALERLAADRDQLVVRIRMLGFRGKAEVMADKVGRTLAEELERLSQQITSMKAEVTAMDTVIETSRSRLRSLERQRLIDGTGGSANDTQAAVSEIDHTLAEELRRSSHATPESELHLDNLLDDVLDARRTLR